MTQTASTPETTSHAGSAPVTLHRQDGIAQIRFNRPQALNAIDLSLARAFHEICRTLAQDDQLRVVVMSGEGRAFMAGGDLPAMQADPVAVSSAIIAEVHPALELLAGLRAPVIAAVHGAVAGGGLGVALASDLVIAAEGTRFNVAYPRIGACADCSTSWGLVQWVGMRKAMELALLADPIDAAEALRLGLINRVVPAQTLVAEAAQLAARLAASAPIALGHLKRQVRQAAHNTLPQQLALEAALFRECAGTEDFREGVQAFLDKREARFQGR